MYQLTSSTGEWWTGAEWSPDRDRALTFSRQEARNMQALIMGLPANAGVYLRQTLDSVRQDMGLGTGPAFEEAAE